MLRRERIQDLFPDGSGIRALVRVILLLPLSRVVCMGLFGHLHLLLDFCTTESTTTLAYTYTA